ncbi:MAG: PaaI family thioesterase [Anaerolineaceae bacterium]
MKKQASSDYCFVCGRENPVSLGLSFFVDENGDTIGHVRFGDQYQGYPGIVHGGVTAAVLDEICGRAFSDNGDQFMVTSELTVRYRKPVPVNTNLIAKGYKVRRRGRVAFARGELLDQTGTVLVEASGTYVDIPEEKLQEMNPESFGWRVTPDEE